MMQEPIPSSPILPKSLNGFTPMELETSIGFLFPILKGKETEKDFISSFTLTFQRGKVDFLFS